MIVEISGYECIKRNVTDILLHHKHFCHVIHIVADDSFDHKRLAACKLSYCNKSNSAMMNDSTKLT